MAFAARGLHGWCSAASVHRHLCLDVLWTCCACDATWKGSDFHTSFTSGGYPRGSTVGSAPTGNAVAPNHRAGRLGPHGPFQCLFRSVSVGVVGSEKATYAFRSMGLLNENPHMGETGECIAEERRFCKQRPEQCGEQRRACCSRLVRVGQECRMGKGAAHIGSFRRWQIHNHRQEAGAAHTISKSAAGDWQAALPSTQ